jgi:hypothetical protein
MKALLTKFFNILFNIGVDTVSDSVQTVRWTIKFWSYLSIILLGSFVLAILYGLYALIF